MGLPSCAEEGLGACCSGPLCSSAQISTCCRLHLVAGCFSPFAGDCSRIYTDVNGSYVSVTTVGQVVPVIQDRSWQCHSCTYEQDLVPGSRTCIMCHSTRRRLHCDPWCVVKSKLVDRTRGSGKSGSPNCRLGDRCKACQLACFEKCIDDIWIDAKGLLK